MLQKSTKGLRLAVEGSSGGEAKGRVKIEDYLKVSLGNNS